MRPGTSTYAFVQWAFFPLGIVIAPTVVYALIQGGVHFAVATYGAVAFLGVTFFALERLMPWRRNWNTPDNDLLNDTLSAVIAYGLLPKLVRPLYVAALAGATAWLAARWGGSLWPHTWPMWAQVVLLLLAGDAGRYWGHRLAHEVPVLWRFHAIHHSATRLWFFNAMRQHPVDKLWFMASELLVPVLMGVSGDVISLYFVVTAFCGFTQHCNIDVRLGPLYWVFNVAELHRWHHSKDAAESNNNYGNNLIVYDRLFGSCYHPEARGETRQVERIGVLNPNYPQHYWGQLMAPFRRGKLDKMMGDGSSHTAEAGPR